MSDLNTSPAGTLIRSAIMAGIVLTGIHGSLAADAKSLPELARDFQQLPMEARRLTGPLFWLHGDESPARLTEYVGKVAEGGNGCFTAESRPHIDWLGPGWYRDLKICLDAAKANNLKMWIFDEKWWPSGEVGRMVPPKYGSKNMQASAKDVKGGGAVRLDVPADKLIAVLAGPVKGAGVDGGALVDLTVRVRDGKLAWDAPAGQWRVMTFTWAYDKHRRYPLVDGASQDAVDWYIKTVYQPHYDHFPDDFGKTIVGYFYDEPETYGDWGTEVIPMLKSRGMDWKKSLVAWKFSLADADEQTAAKYQYQDAFAEAWGKCLYGGVTQWCHDHKVRSIGHWLEHKRLYLHPRKCAGNMFQVQKYSDVGAIDAVYSQFAAGRKDDSTYQTPKLGSSISHAYGKKDDLAMVEIFGARGQNLSYPEMKWWTDHMHVSGINFHIPHSFNPRSPYDRDCPPYFYNGGFEPRWPLYRVYADYTTRLSLMLTGGRHVCPVALLFLGQSVHAGKALTPEKMTTALQDGLIDCDWMPYDVFQADMKVAGRQLELRDERYRVLIVPAVEVIPYGVLAKVKEFFDAGGAVIGYGMLPTRSATPGRGSKDIAAIAHAIWGESPKQGLGACRTNARGGRSYFLPAEPSTEQMQQVITGDAGIHPTLEVLEGDTNHWLHVLHRVKAGCDVFFITNQDHAGPARTFKLRARAAGRPQCWDAMRNTIRDLAFKRVDENTADFDLTLQPNESMLVVFGKGTVAGATQIAAGARARASIKPRRLAVEVKLPQRKDQPVPTPGKTTLAGCWWVWHGADGTEVPPGKRYFRGQVMVRKDRKMSGATMSLTADNRFELYVNGQKARKSGEGDEDWRNVKTVDLSKLLKPGRNVLAIEAANGGDAPNPAGVIGRIVVKYAGAEDQAQAIDKTWRSAGKPGEGWQGEGFDDSAWKPVARVASYGQGAWGAFEGGASRRRRFTAVNMKADPYRGEFDVPADWLGKGKRVMLECEGIAPEPAGAVRVGGEYVGGFIGKPLTLDLTGHLKPGRNVIDIQPFAPASVMIKLYGE